MTNLMASLLFQEAVKFIVFLPFGLLYCVENIILEHHNWENHPQIIHCFINPGNNSLLIYLHYV